jgi:hypothetical protein
VLPLATYLAVSALQAEWLESRNMDKQDHFGGGDSFLRASQLCGQSRELILTARQLIDDTRRSLASSVTRIGTGRPGAGALLDAPQDLGGLKQYHLVEQGPALGMHVQREQPE